MIFHMYFIFHDILCISSYFRSLLTLFKWLLLSINLKRTKLIGLNLFNIRSKICTRSISQIDFLGYLQEYGGHSAQRTFSVWHFEVVVTTFDYVIESHNLLFL